jgi:predicted ATPase
MKRFILTGAPGAGKTAILRQLECAGFGVVEEAATDVIALAQAQGDAEPWKQPWFIDTVAELQGRRLARAATIPDKIQFHDRSIICTAALANYLGYRMPERLSHEVDRLREQAIFEKIVFFIRNLGFITATGARRINFEEALRFERIHEETYRNYGFEIVFVEPAGVLERAAFIQKMLSEMQNLT